MSIDLKVAYEDSIARVSCAKIMYATNSDTGACGRFNAFALLMWQFVIQKLAGCIVCDTSSPGNHGTGNNQCRYRIRTLPSGYARQSQ